MTALFSWCRVGECTLIGASGEYSDFQHIMETLEDYHQYDVNMDDGFERSPAEIYNLLRTIMYNRRTCYEDNILATGFGGHLALPILRKKWRPDLEEGEARWKARNNPMHSSVWSLCEIETGGVFFDRISTTRSVLVWCKRSKVLLVTVSVPSTSRNLRCIHGLIISRHRSMKQTRGIDARWASQNEDIAPTDKG
ncbi:unnamed protein product [Ectocarpus sp. CCAP 1310/34]|nr:unnamed protein product [Ectocarpus sp. CCAP 1310/34]